MANDVTPSTLPAWRPKQEKTIRTILTVLFWGTLATVGAGIFVKVGPTWVTALSLLQKMTENLITLAITVGIGAVVLFLLSETFTKNGSINKLFNQWYSGFTLKLTYELLEINPMSPLFDQKREMEARRDEFAEAFKKFDGTISNMAANRDKFAAQAKDAEGRAKAAKKRFDETQNADYSQAFQTASYECGSFTRSANSFADKIAKLIPIRERIKDLRNATDVVIANLGTDITTLQAEWDAQLNMTAIEGAARKVLSGTEKKELAQQATALIEQRYAESIGHLTNLADTAKPFLMSIDLDKGTYSEALLEKWETEAQISVVPVTAQIEQSGVKSGYASLL